MGGANRPRPGRRLLAALLLALLLVGLVEGVSFLLWRLTEGRAFSWADAARRRAEVAAAARATPPPPAEEGPGTPAPPTAPYLRHEILHPFFGYTLDPDLNLLPEERFPGFVVTPLGFFAERAAAGAERRRSGEGFRVAVFGGSVAQVFSFQGRAALAGELAAAGRAPAGGVEVASFALGGYKQPQQLLVLAWLLARGERFDAVVALDGFNEVALPPLENVPHRVNPFYPRGWRLRVRQVPDGRFQELVGELAWRRRRRAERAAAFSASPLRLSVTASLVARALDRRAALAIADAERAVAAYDTPRHRRSVARGPDSSYRDDDELYRDLAQVWAGASRAMHDLCAARGIPYHHFLQPNQYVPGSKPLSAEERAGAYGERHPFRPVVEAGWPHLVAAGRGLAADGVAFHDLTGLFAGRRETIYVDDCCHVNQHGNDLLGAAVGRALAGGTGGVRGR